jgi:hypothetical protein
MQGDQKCGQVEPTLREVQSRHWASCHHVSNFEQAPVTKPQVQHKREDQSTVATEVKS